MLVTTVLLGILGVVLVRIYDVSRAAYATGVGRLALQQRAREALRRISPLLTSAVPPSEVQDAILRPAVGAGPGPEVVFHNPTDVFDPRSPTYRKVRLFHTPDTKEVVVDGDTPSDPSDDRVVARQVDSLTFEVLAQNAVRVRVKARGQVRGATNRERSQDYELSTVVLIQFYSTR